MNDSRSDTNAVETLRCRKCGSTNVNLDGWDIDKCGDCGHWRYRGQEKPAECCHGVDDICVSSGCLMGIVGGENG